MPRVIYNTATSFNGYIADEANSLAWLFEVPDRSDQDQDAPDQPDFMAGVGVVVTGSTTYEWLLNEEDVLAQPSKWQEFYADRPVYVFTSRNLPRPEGADIRFVSGPVAGSFAAIASAAGDKVVWVAGGGDLVGQFYDAGLLDEIRLTVAPVTLVGGAPLLPRTIRAQNLTLTGVRQAGAFAELTYTVSR